MIEKPKFCPFRKYSPDCYPSCALFDSIYNCCSFRLTALKLSKIAAQLEQKGGAEHGKESRTERVPKQE